MAISYQNFAPTEPVTATATTTTIDNIQQELHNDLTVVDEQESQFSQMSLDNVWYLKSTMLVAPMNVGPTKTLHVELFAYFA